MVGEVGDVEDVGAEVDGEVEVGLCCVFAHLQAAVRITITSL